MNEFISVCGCILDRGIASPFVQTAIKAAIDKWEEKNGQDPAEALKVTQFEPWTDLWFTTKLPSVNWAKNRYNQSAWHAANQQDRLNLMLSHHFLMLEKGVIQHDYQVAKKMIECYNQSLFVRHSSCLRDFVYLFVRVACLSDMFQVMLCGQVPPIQKMDANLGRVSFFAAPFSSFVLLLHARPPLFFYSFESHSLSTAYHFNRFPNLNTHVTRKYTLWHAYSHTQ